MRSLFYSLSWLIILLIGITHFVHGSVPHWKYVDNDQCISTTDTLTGITVYSFVDKMPVPVKGEQALYEKIRELKVNVTVNEIIQTKIVVAFIIDIDGKLMGKRVIANITGTDLAEKLLIAMEDINWIAGTCNGTPVPVMYLLPVEISLQ